MACVTFELYCAVLLMGNFNYLSVESTFFNLFQRKLNNLTPKMISFIAKLLNNPTHRGKMHMYFLFPPLQGYYMHASPDWTLVDVRGAHHLCFEDSMFRLPFL